MTTDPIPPPPSKDVGFGLISRPRLLESLDRSLHVRLTSLVGGPGTGKTTLLSQWAASRIPAQCIRLNGLGLSALPRRLVEELRLVVPGLSPDLLVALDEPGGESGTGLMTRLDALAAELCHQLARKLTRDLVLIVDDLQDVDDDGAALLANLARHAPPRLHLILASREDLPFPTGRLRLAGHTVGVDASDLAMTADEIGALAELLGHDASPPAIDRILAHTGGWALAVSFALRSSAVEPTRPDPDDLFAYLAEEVLGSEAPAATHLLRLAAELPWVDVELIRSLGFTEGTISSIRTYATPVGIRPGAMSVTPLVGDFLRSQPPLESQPQLLLEAGDWYRSRDFLSEALQSWRRSGDVVGLIDRLDLHGSSLTAGGLARLLADTLEEIDPTTGIPDRLQLLRAEALTTLGEWDRALAVYQTLASPDGDLPTAVAWRYGLLHYMRGDVESALEIYQRGVGAGHAADDSALAAWTASAHWLRGDRDTARALAGEALTLAGSSGDSRSLATAHTVLAMVAALDGDRSANDSHYLRALEHAEKARDIVGAARIRTNRSSHFLEEGRYDAALAELEVALRLADLSGFLIFRGIALANRGEALLHLGRLDEAVSELRESRRTFRQLGSTLEAYPLAHLGDAYVLRGDANVARGAYETAIELGRKSNDLQALVPALAGLARIVVDEDPERALSLAEEAARVPAVLGHVKGVLAMAVAAAALGDRDRALVECRRAADVARGRDDAPGLAEALLLEARLMTKRADAEDRLAEANALFEDMGDPIGQARVMLALAEKRPGAEGGFLAREAAERLHRLGAKGIAREAGRMARGLSEGSAGGVEIRTLGGFSLLVNGTRVAASAWQSRVARELLWMLIAARGRPLHREVLIERLWPNEDPGRTGNRLSVALSTVRSVLDPDRTQDPNRYLNADRDSVSLATDHLTIDVEDFLADAGHGAALLREGRRVEGLAALHAAESRYLGDFLEESPYADWAIPLREEARSAYLDLCGSLAGDAMARAEYDTAARHYLRLLERDPYHETAHLGLIRAMLAAGRWGTSRRLYGIYVARMAELEVEPAPFPSEPASTDLSRSAS